MIYIQLFRHMWKDLLRKYWLGRDAFAAEDRFRTETPLMLSSAISELGLRNLCIVVSRPWGKSQVAHSYCHLKWLWTIQSAEWTGRSANAWLGPYEENKERWKAASPLAYAGADTPPFLFVNSGRARFHAGRDDLITVLQAHNIYYQQHTFEEAPHSFWLVHPWFNPTLAQIEAFLKTVFPKN